LVSAGADFVLGFNIFWAAFSTVSTSGFLEGLLAADWGLGAEAGAGAGSGAGAVGGGGDMALPVPADLGSRSEVFLFCGVDAVFDFITGKP
jgi:hypothetical protein